jgi:molybdate transport system regulatory protein
MKKPAKFVIEPRFRITCGRRFAFGPGKAALLEHIAKTGSIGEAAKAMNMSYMRAWTLLKSLNRGCAEPLVETLRGGRQHGGAKLTKTGVLVLQLYREIERQSVRKTRAAQQKLLRQLSF